MHWRKKQQKQKELINVRRLIRVLTSPQQEPAPCWCAQTRIAAERNRVQASTPYLLKAKFNTKKTNKKKYKEFCFQSIPQLITSNNLNMCFTVRPDVVATQSSTPTLPTCCPSADMHIYIREPDKEMKQHQTTKR